MRLRRPVLLFIGLASVATSVGVIFAAGEDRIFPVVENGCQETDAINNGSVCLADSSGHTVFVDFLGPKLKSATQWTLNNSYNTISPFSIQYVSNPITSGAGETDVLYGVRNDLPDFVFAFTGCNDNLGGFRCDQFYVNYHGDFICSQSYWCNTSTIHISLACHETGHTFGLMHPEASNPARLPSQTDYYCMRTDYAVFASYYVGSQNVYAMQSIQWPAGYQ